ncbi:MAG: M23 family metallopeptidase [Oscillospiraceae bacterium]
MKLKQISQKETISELEKGLPENSLKTNKKKHVFLDIFTLQSIFSVIIVIVMVTGHTFLPSKFNNAFVTIKNLTQNDFSFKDFLYEKVGETITTLNKFTPSQSSSEKLDGVGGEKNPVTPKVVPHNATFAPIINTGTITFPVTSEYKITSPFGFRLHPITNKDDFHQGVDIATKEGVSIKAIANGTVTKVGQDDSLGNYIVIDHKNGFISKYAHCSKVIAQENNIIREGEVIAKVGATGETTGPHLHLATIKNGLYFNPMNLFERSIL